SRRSPRPRWTGEQRTERARRGQRTPAGPAEKSPPRVAQVARHLFCLSCQLLKHVFFPRFGDENGTGNHVRTATAAPDPVAGWRLASSPGEPERTNSMCWRLLTIPLKAIWPRSSIRKAFTTG